MSGEECRRPRGRPRGSSGARARILDSARELFSHSGVEKTSIRAVARRAGVDPAAVHYHFGNKLLLFGAVAQVSVEREPLVESLRVTPVGELGITLTSLVLRLWDFDLRTVFLATLRSQATAANFDTAWSQLREALIGEVARRVDQPPGTVLVRAELAAAQLLGAVMARHVLELESVASASAEWVVQAVAPSVQHYLTGALPDADDTSDGGGVETREKVTRCV